MYTDPSDFAWFLLVIGSIKWAWERRNHRPAWLNHLVLVTITLLHLAGLVLLILLVWFLMATSDSPL